MGSDGVGVDGDHANSGSLFRVGESVHVAQLLVFLSLLVVALAALEQLLHKLEHSVKRSRKHDEMLRKAYRELMILGFLGVSIKVYKEITHVSAYSDALVAFQCADLTIFILAVALILQALCVFLALRHENYELEEAELLSAGELAAAIAERERAASHPGVARRLLAWPTWWCASRRHVDHYSDAELRDLAELRVLRHLFLRRYGLPELFPFSKYVRQAQDNQITHMIDVEISMWLLLLGVAWALDGSIVLLQRVHGFELESHAIVVVFLVFAWSLVALHALVAWYFRRSLVQLLRAGGLEHTRDTVACLAAIGDDENASLREDMADDALAGMQNVQERQDAKYREKKRQRRKRHPHLVERDTGFQLLVTAVRHVTRWCRQSCNGDDSDHEEEGSKPRDSRLDSDARLSTATTVTPAASIDLGVFLTDLRQQQEPNEATTAPLHRRRRRSTELRVQLRWFSRKAWQFAVMCLLMLNGFYVALLCQCVFYQFGLLSTYSPALRVVLVLGLPLPVALNMALLQPQILRNFMIVSSILQVDVATLSKVVTHFSEIVELRAEFVRTLLACLDERGVSRAQFQRVLEARDREGTGTLEIEQLRLALRDVGFRLSHFRFNSVAKLLFQLKGTTVELSQVLRMIALAQPAVATETDHDVPHEHHVGHVLLRQSVFFEDGDERLAQIPPEDSPETVNPGGFAGRCERLPTPESVESARAGATDATGVTGLVLPTVSETAPFGSGLVHGDPTAMARRPSGFPRRQSGFQNTSARTLRSLYLLSGGSDTDEDATADPHGTGATVIAIADLQEPPQSPSNASVYTRM